MGIFVNVLILAIAFTTFVISGGYITDCSRRIASIPDYKNDANLSKAHGYSAWAAVIVWLSVALMILAVVLYIIFAIESAELTAGYFIDLLLILSLAGCVTVGILSALTAYQIGQSKVSDNKGSYRQAIIACVLAIVVAFLIILGFILKIVYKPKSENYDNIASLFGDKANYASVFINNPKIAAELL